MEHNDARHKLSEYIDGSVTAEERAAIEEHLKTCSVCSDALRELQKTVEHIKSIEEVEPPAWLTQKIMTNVRSGAEEKKGLFQRLFSPLSVKLPIQAVAVLFLAVTAFYLYQNMQPTAKYAEAPLERFKAREEAPLTLAPKPEQKIRREPVTPAKKVPQTPEYKALDMKQEYEQPAPPSLQDKAAASAPAAAKPFAAPETAQNAEESQGDAMSQGALPSTAKQENSALARGLTAGAEPQMEDTALVAKAKSARPEGGEKNAVDLTIKVKAFDTAEKEIEKAVTAFGGKIIRTEPSVDQGPIIVSINKDKFAELLSKLKTIGEVKEKAPAPTGREGYLTIRITLTIN